MKEPKSPAEAAAEHAKWMEGFTTGREVGKLEAQPRKTFGTGEYILDTNRAWNLRQCYLRWHCPYCTAQLAIAEREWFNAMLRLQTLAGAHLTDHHQALTDAMRDMEME